MRSDQKGATKSFGTVELGMGKLSPPHGDCPGTAVWCSPENVRNPFALIVARVLTCPSAMVMLLGLASRTARQIEKASLLYRMGTGTGAGRSARCRRPAAAAAIWTRRSSRTPRGCSHSHPRIAPSWGVWGLAKPQCAAIRTTATMSTHCQMRPMNLPRSLKWAKASQLMSCRHPS